MLGVLLHSPCPSWPRTMMVVRSSCFIRISHPKNQPLVSTACYASMDSLLGLYGEITGRRYHKRDKDRRGTLYPELRHASHVAVEQDNKKTLGREVTELLYLTMAITPSARCGGHQPSLKIFLCAPSPSIVWGARSIQGFASVMMFMTLPLILEELTQNLLRPQSGDHW